MKNICYHVVVFILTLVLASIIKSELFKHGYVLPRFAEWEIAALVHVFKFAWEMMAFKGLMYVSMTFNSMMKRIVLVIIGLILYFKVIVIIAETKVIGHADKIEPLVRFAEKINNIENVVHYISRFVLVYPMFFFLIVNLISFLIVKRETKKLGLQNTSQEKYLKNIILYVDMLPTLFFLLFLTGLWLDSDLRTDSIIGIVCCGALTVSNIVSIFVVEMPLISEKLIRRQY